MVLPDTICRKMVLSYIVFVSSSIIQYKYTNSISTRYNIFLVSPGTVPDSIEYQYPDQDQIRYVKSTVAYNPVSTKY